MTVTREAKQQDSESQTNGIRREQNGAAAAASLIQDYQKVCLEFDELERDLYKAGTRMEPLMSDFMARHQDYLDRVKFEFSQEVKKVIELKSNEDLINGRKINENLLDDLRVINTIECKQTDELKPQELMRRIDNDNYFNLDNRSHLNALLADLFRRMSEACYARLTYLKCRHKVELDRKTPVKWAQFSIRHNPNDFKACYWYMITVGRYSELDMGARDRVLAGESFKRSILRCLRMEPRDPLSHHLLGRYYYHIGGLNWVQRTFLKSFFNFKVEGTYEDAEREFRLAHAIKDDWMPVGLWMARVLLAQKKPMAEVRYWIELGLKLDVLEPSCEMERAELVELANRLDIKIDDCF